MRILRVLNSTTNRNVATLVGATALAQVIQLLATPFLTRIYSPVFFAPFQVFTSLASVLAVVATLRYEMAIVIADNEKHARILVTMAAGIATLIALLSGLVLIVADTSGWLDTGWIFLAGIPAYVFASGLQQSGNNWSIRNGTFQRNVAARISGSLTQASAGLILGGLGFLSSGLMLSMISAQFVSAGLLIRNAIESPRRWFAALRSSEGKVLLREHNKFPRFNTPHALLDVLQDHGIVFLFGIFFPGSLLAFYGQAFRLLKAPVGFVGSAIHQVFFPDFTRRWQAGDDLRPVVRKFYLTLFFLGLPFFGTLAWFSVPVFTWFLGAEWSGVGEVAAILMPWLFLNFIASPLSSLPIIASSQGTAVMLASLEFVLRCVGVVLAGIADDSQLALICLSSIGCAFTLINMTWYLRLARKS
jgi:O-antigen/teichoic acid export membrane protein